MPSKLPLTIEKSLYDTGRHTIEVLSLKKGYQISNPGLRCRIGFSKHYRSKERFTEHNSN